MGTCKMCTCAHRKQRHCCFCWRWQTRDAAAAAFDFLCLWPMHSLSKSCLQIKTLTCRQDQTSCLYMKNHIQGSSYEVQLPKYRFSVVYSEHEVDLLGLNSPPGNAVSASYIQMFWILQAFKREFWVGGFLSLIIMTYSFAGFDTISSHLSAIFLGSSQVLTVILALASKPVCSAAIPLHSPWLTLHSVQEHILYGAAGCFAIYIRLAHRRSVAGLILFLHSSLNNLATKKDLVYRYLKGL